jgi:hypothetical protein
MSTWLRWAAMALLCTQFAACALRPGSQDASAQDASAPAQSMGNAAATPAAASSPEGAAVAAELGYHGPVRRPEANTGN